KQLTGGDLIKARRMREDFWSFSPTHKFWVCANYKPDVRGRDEAIWRRIRLIPFTVTIPKSERDPKLLEKLRAELPGILRWAVEGCLEWQKRGLGIPAKVEAATQDYKAETDRLGPFVTDRCYLREDASAPAGQLYEAYQLWCSENGERPLQQRTF